MAIKLFKVDNFHSGLHKEFFIDGENDLEQIEVEFDCELGDKAYTPNGTIYTRHSDEFDGDLWEEIEVSGGSSENNEEEESSKKGLEVFLIDPEDIIPLSSDLGESVIYFGNPNENQAYLPVNLFYKYVGNFSDLGNENNPKILAVPGYFENWENYNTKGEIFLPIYTILSSLNSEYISEVSTGVYYLAENTPIIMCDALILIPSDISIVEGTAGSPEPGDTNFPS